MMRGIKKTDNPCYEGLSRPQVIEILKLLPKTNCRECGVPTCMVFAAQMAEEIKGIKDCSQLDDLSKKKLETYLDTFGFSLQ